MSRAWLPSAVASIAAALCLAASAQAEVAQQANLRVSFAGKIVPHSLPRVGTAPVSVSLAGEIKTTDGTKPPQLRTIAMAINRNGHLDYKGLPRCNFHQIQPATTTDAKAACRRSLVGTGTFEANVALPEQSPFPSNGKVLAFNGNLHGSPVIYAHVYGTEPLPTSFVLPFRIDKGQGAYGTILKARLPQVAAEWGFVSGVSLTLKRSFGYRGARHSYLAAGCPAPKGFGGATFAFVKASFGFEDGRTLSSTMQRSCGVRTGGGHGEQHGRGLRGRRASPVQTAVAQIWHKSTLAPASAAYPPDIRAHRAEGSLLVG